jgi:hypothetical protein
LQQALKDLAKGPWGLTAFPYVVTWFFVVMVLSFLVKSLGRLVNYLPLKLAFDQRPPSDAFRLHLIRFLMALAACNGLTANPALCLKLVSSFGFELLIHSPQPKILHLTNQSTTILFAPLNLRSNGANSDWGPA